MKNRIKAVMIGHAVGDALGVPVEFCFRNELDQQPVKDMMGYGTYPVPAGAWSDDTSMALAALDGLAIGKVDYHLIMDNFARWACLDEYTPTGEMFDIGHSCYDAIKRYLESDRSDALGCGGRGERENGNGSLMRIHPFSLYTWFNKEDCEAVIDNASALTHAHDRSKLACRIYTNILHCLLGSPSKYSVKSALRMAKCKYIGHTEYSHFERLFSDYFDKLPREEIKSSGYVVNTLEAAVWCLLTTDNYSDCVLKAVNLGEDTDTTAAVAGGLAGALYGYDAIPVCFRNALIKREYIEDICEKASIAWSKG